MGNRKQGSATYKYVLREKDLRQFREREREIMREYMRFFVVIDEIVNQILAKIKG
jgi:hypothetical protein